MRLISHSLGDDPLDLVHFLYNSLLKMSRRYQKQPLSSPQYVYHHGLIKILVQHQLNKKKKTWDEFLVAEGFQGMTSRKKMGHPRSKKRVNSQDEELEKEVSSQANSENGSEHLELRGKSSSSSRLTQSSARKSGIGPSDPFPVLKPFPETYTRKKKRFPSSAQEIESLEVKVPSASSKRETMVLTRSSAKKKSKPVKPPETEVQSSSEEIHVTESEVEIIREANIITSNVIIKKRRSLVLFDPSSSSSDHSIPTPQKEVSNSRRPVRKKDKEPLVYYVRTPHTHLKNKLHYNFKLMDNSWLKDHIINVDESPPEKKGKKPARKDGAKSVKQMKTKKMDGLELLLAVLDSLN